MNHTREVRLAADQVFEFLVDLSLLFVRRRRIAFLKAQQPSPVAESWGSYIVNKLPFATESQKMHALFRPDSSSIGGRLYYDAGASVAPSVVSNTPSVMALRRLDEHRTSGMDASYTFDDEVDESEDEFEVDEKMSQTNVQKQVQKMESSLREFENSRYVIDSKRDDTANIDDNESSQHEFTADDLFSTDNDYAHDEEETTDGRSSVINTSDDAASILQNFNSAMSSHTGSYFASSHSGSYFSASEQDGAPGSQSKSRQVQKHQPQRLRQSAINRLQGFSFPEEKQNTIHEGRSEYIQEEDSHDGDYKSTLSVEVSEEGEYT